MKKHHSHSFIDKHRRLERLKVLIFRGYSVKELAEILDVHERTVIRDIGELRVQENWEITYDFKLKKFIVKKY
jgi:transposase